ncbi:lytic transglycosylase domain-containing protein [Longimicrobium sp.]|uniref:lytic transglycosylase domain-containing protein n=1 Tax=Longimicrobium sp. TaxID=2029185 RepID=UPI002D0B9102|nr:lytic transglycosylase domain-containing protein [Longimicrobium sp.]HSU16144.1 lytic transglycosylase domain-containing protein [Longimicrobium sp.]
MKHTLNIVHCAGIAGVLAGLVFGGSAHAVRDFPRMSQLAPKVDLDPFRAVTHAGMLVAARTAQARLDDGRPWAAWNAIRDFAGDDADELPPSVALLAARAAAGWDGWSHVRRLLEGRDWLAREDGGAGLMLLGRAEEAARDWDAAARAYRGYARAAAGSDRGMAYARLGRVLRAAGHDREAAEAFAKAGGELPEVADWLAALRADALEDAGEGVAAPASGSAAARAWAARAEARSRSARGDRAGASALLAREAEAIADDDPSLAAELQVQRARILAGEKRAAEVRGELRAAAADARVEPAVRVSAAGVLADLPGGLSAEEQVARAAAYESAGKPGLAAKALRVALSRGAAADGATLLRISRLLFDAADYAPAREWALKAAEKLDGEGAAEAELISARALVRRGEEDDGVAALRRLIERRAGTAAAGSAWFLLGDAASDRDAAIAGYRRAAASQSPFAREAQYRVGDRCLKAGDDACAAKAWEDYAARWPRGEETARAAYMAGVLHERAGRADRARAMYAAAIAADPVDYYAIRAADRLGADPLADVAARPAAWAVTVGDDGEVAGVVRRLAALEAAGAEEAWKAEMDSQTRRFADRPYALLLLAEGVRDAGHTVDAIRIGRRLLEMRGGAWDLRLLRVVFPFPYREILADEAERSDIDPWLLAGLVRQESSFNHEARSWVGATGLSQIMPSTGAWLAPAAGVKSYDPSLLAVPEINLRMGARYLRDQLRRYRGARDLALAAYNAGPGRADRWKSELGYGRDVDAFREKIPFAETREYVKVVIRNAEVYRRLYGPSRSPGLADGER